MAQQQAGTRVTLERVLPLVKHVHFGDGMLTRPCPDQNVAITYGQMDDLLKLCDLVAQVMAGCSPDIKRLCDEILASCAESRQIYIESKTEGRGKPWDAKCRTASSRSFVNQFRVSTRNVRRPIGDLMLGLSRSLAAKAIVGDVVRRMFRSAVSIAQLSRKLVVAQRDWDSWGEDGVFGGYYRAQALQAAMEYHWRVKKHSADPTSTTFDFGDFPSTPPPEHSLAHSVYVPRARSAQGRRAEAQGALER